MTTQEHPAEASNRAQETFSGQGNGVTRVDLKNAAALNLRRIHSESIRRRALMLDGSLGVQALAMLMQAAELLEGGE